VAWEEDAASSTGTLVHTGTHYDQTIRLFSNGPGRWRPKALDKGGGMWPMERASDFVGSVLHEGRKVLARLTNMLSGDWGGGSGGSAVAKR